MQEPDVLRRVRERAGELVAQNLRSASVVLSHMRELIQEAHDIGHSHQAIHASLKAAGLRASWNTYRSCLMRMKKASGARATGQAAADSSAARPMTLSMPVPRFEDGAPRPVTVNASNPFAGPCATRVLDALVEAKKVASRDYAQIARDLHRKSRK